jgi:hypothetical protein
MTGAWSKGCRKHYAYYLCQTRGCAEKGKSIPKAKLEKGLEAIMRSLTPSARLVELAKVMLRDAWSMRLASAKQERDAWGQQLKDVEKQIEDALDRIMDAESKTVIRAIEKRIDDLERKKVVLSERASKPLPDRQTQKDCIELSLAFLSSPWIIYEKASFAVQQLVLRLAFAEPLSYCRKEAYRTPEISLPFKVLGEISGQKSKMVPPERLELPTL